MPGYCSKSTSLPKHYKPSRLTSWSWNSLISSLSVRNAMHLQVSSIFNGSQSAQAHSKSSALRRATQHDSNGILSVQKIYKNSISWMSTSPSTNASQWILFLQNKVYFIAEAGCHSNISECLIWNW